jgi:hypothetical protein
VGASGRTARPEDEISPRVRTRRTWIAAQDLGPARPAIEALSERGRRFGTGPIELRELERGGGELLVEIRGVPPRLEGWEVVGRLEHDGGGPARLGFVGPGLDPVAWSRAEPWCEHCGLLRRRTVTYLVRSGRGEIRQIGSSCLRDYTGHDLARAVWQAELLERGAAAIERTARSPGTGVSRHPPLEEFLALVVRVVDERQGGTFVSRSRSSQRRPASADLALGAWADGKRLREGDLERARDLIAWGQN